MSYWDAPRPVRRRRAIDVDALARAAAELLDLGGFPALTMRAAAERLGVAAASLYSRVRGVDDLRDLALDAALADDGSMQQAVAEAAIDELMLAYFRHLRRHPWAGQVIALRTPRGPHYLALSERMCVLLRDAGMADPLGCAYALSNLVIGSALTSAMAAGEQAALVDPTIAPVYAELHAGHTVDPEQILTAAVQALLAAAPTR